MHWVYIDESGGHNLGRPDPNYPVFVLCATVFDQESYADGLVPALTRIKLHHLGHDGHPLHEVEIRKRLGPFSFSGEVAARERFMGDLDKLVEAHAAQVFATAVLPSYQQRTEADIAAARHLLDTLRQARPGPLSLLLESRGKMEDARLRAVLEAGSPSGIQVDFCAKNHAVPGLELADLLARPIGLSFVRQGQPNRAQDRFLNAATIRCLK
jgi:hypothetical protein